MKCPNCQKENLTKGLFYQTEIDYCPKCLGLWFDKDELRIAKDEKDESLRWLDVDLFHDQKKFNLRKDKKFCPKCLVPFYEVSYNNSDIKVDLCNLCFGIWLDRGEFKKIIHYLKKQEKDQALYNYPENLVKQFKEVFSGKEGFESELGDFLSLLKLLKYKFAIQYKNLAKVIEQMPY